MTTGENPGAAGHQEPEKENGAGKLEERVAKLLCASQRHNPVPERQGALIVGLGYQHTVHEVASSLHIAGLDCPLCVGQGPVDCVAGSPHGIGGRRSVIVRHRFAIPRRDSGISHSLQLHALPAIRSIPNALQRFVGGEVELLAGMQQRGPLLVALRCQRRRGKEQQRHQATHHGDPAELHRPSAVRRAVCFVISSGVRGAPSSPAAPAAPVRVVVLRSRAAAGPASRRPRYTTSSHANVRITAISSAITGRLLPPVPIRIASRNAGLTDAESATPRNVGIAMSGGRQDRSST